MLLTDNWIENNIETYLCQHTPKSPFIYWIILISLSAFIISLPYMYIDLSVQGNGIIRPVTEKTEIKSTVTELVDSVYVKEGEYIKEGDVILCLNTNKTDYQINYQRNRINDCQSHIADLNYLVKGEKPESFHSYVRQQEYIYFNKKKIEVETTLQQAKKEYIRNKRLYEMRVISEEEYEHSFFKYQKQQAELASLIENQLNIWQTDLNDYQNSYNEMHTSLNQETKTKEHYIIRSPINGTIDSFSGIYKGSCIQIGQTLAVISPDSTLCLEVYVTPKNIGFIHTGMNVNIQIEAFNYNEWGCIKGIVNEISSDLLTDDKGTSFYRIKCQMEKNYLTHRNGKKALLKKGMTANANFMVTQCSLFDLIYKQMDNWINPTLDRNEKTL